MAKKDLALSKLPGSTEIELSIMPLKWEGESQNKVIIAGNVDQRRIITEFSLKYILFSCKDETSKLLKSYDN